MPSRTQKVHSHEPARAHRGQPDDSPVQERRGVIVHLRQSQRRHPGRQEKARHQCGQADDEHRADQHHHRQPDRRVALIEHEERRDRRRGENRDAQEVEAEAQYGVGDLGQRSLGPGLDHLSAQARREVAEQPLGNGADGEEEGDADQDHQQDAGIAIPDQLLRQKHRHGRQSRSGGEHPPPCPTQGRRLGLDIVDVAVRGFGGRGGDLLVELGDQELAHLGIAEPRQQVAQRLAGQRLGQGGRRHGRRGDGRCGSLGTLAEHLANAGTQQKGRNQTLRDETLNLEEGPSWHVFCLFRLSPPRLGSLDGTGVKVEWPRGETYYSPARAGANSRARRRCGSRCRLLAPPRRPA